MFVLFITTTKSLQRHLQPKTKKGTWALKAWFDTYQSTTNAAPTNKWFRLQESTCSISPINLIYSRLVPNDLYHDPSVPRRTMHPWYLKVFYLLHQLWVWKCI